MPAWKTSFFVATALLAAGWASARQVFLGEDSDLFRPADSCPMDVISCTVPAADTCCSPKYGLVILAQQWTRSTGPSDSFTVHGLWPDTCNGRMAPRGGCDASRTYHNISSIVESQDAPLLDWMSTYWPSYKDDNNLFWAHEWNKHGTCVTTLDPKCQGDDYVPFSEVPAYFGQVQKVFQKYNLYKALKQQGVVPGGQYALVTFVAAIKNKLNVEPRLYCRGRVLQEVRLTFHVKGQSTYLPAEPYHNHNCPKIIHYPSKRNNEAI